MWGGGKVGEGGVTFQAVECASPGQWQWKEQGVGAGAGAGGQFKGDSCPATAAGCQFKGDHHITIL